MNPTVRVVLATSALLTTFYISSCGENTLAEREARIKQGECEIAAHQAQAHRQITLDKIMPPAEYFNAVIYHKATETSEALFQHDMQECLP